jgi:hypothetical protein
MGMVRRYGSVYGCRQVHHIIGKWQGVTNRRYSKLTYAKANLWPGWKGVGPSRVMQ